MTKSCLIIKIGMKDLAMEIFKGNNKGKTYLGAVIGSPEFKSAYMKNLVDKWILELQELSRIAKTEPHAAYPNFVFISKRKWNYYMRTVPNLSDHLQLLEDSVSSRLQRSSLEGRKG